MSGGSRVMDGTRGRKLCRGREEMYTGRIQQMEERSYRLKCEVTCLRQSTIRIGVEKISGGRLGNG